MHSPSTLPGRPAIAATGKARMTGGIDFPIGRSRLEASIALCRLDMRLIRKLVRASCVSRAFGQSQYTGNHSRDTGGLSQGKPHFALHDLPKE